MAYLYARKNGRVEIRESHSTVRGPRSRTLASFKGPLTDDHLDRAENASVRGIDGDAICERARELGITVVRSSADTEARSLIGRLRGGARLDPVLATVLRERLDDLPAAAVPDELADVIDWIGASDQERGRALRDVLRLYDTIARSRDAVPVPEALRFPRFEIRSRQRAS